MITINKNDITEIEYQIEIEGLNLNDITEIRFSIQMNNYIHSIIGIRNIDKVYFKINPLIFDSTSYSFHIEVITNHYIFTVIKDTLLLNENMKIKLINSTHITENKKHPTVKLKL